MTTILLADDHNVIRNGLRLLLESETGLQVVGEAADGREAIQLVEDLQPDILVVDLMMPGPTGMEVTRQVKKLFPHTRVIVLSMYDTEAYVVEVLQAGASAYVLKKSTSGELIQAIQQVLAGNLYLSPPLNKRAIDAYLQHSRESKLDPYEGLTPREREVLRLAAEGLTNPEIAEVLSLSPRTIEMHRGNMMRKLHLNNQSELIRYALKMGILSMD
jgi:DNA-binding NarL/FixJ family response regulator